MISDNTLIGPGPGCWECGGTYGQHEPNCPIGLENARLAKAEEELAKVRDCFHDFKPSGLYLLNEKRQGVEVMACSKCGLLIAKQESEINPE